MLLEWAHQAMAAHGGDVPPVPLAVSDFKNGAYSIGGVEKTLADLWENGTANWGTFDPSSVVPGIGLVGAAGAINSAPVSTAELITAIGDIAGLTAVIEYQLDGLSFDGRFFATYFSSPAYVSGWEFFDPSADQRQFYDLSFSVWEFFAALPTGQRRVALNYAQTGLAVSANGGAVDTTGAPEDGATFNAFGLYARASGTGVCTVEKITFYALQPDAALPALSA